MKLLAAFEPLDAAEDGGGGARRQARRPETRELLAAYSKPLQRPVPRATLRALAASG